MSASTGGYLIWIDIEMTGLDPKKDKIVEIATTITDSNLNIIAEGPDLVIGQTQSTIDNMSDWCKEHFADSGLLESIRSSNITLQEAEEQTLRFVMKHCSSKTALLAGNSVHIDREFLAMNMPKFVNYLHYRIIDVATIKELYLRWYPSLPPFPKIEPHRAHDDIVEAINELKYYKETVFK